MSSTFFTSLKTLGVLALLLIVLPLNLAIVLITLLGNTIASLFRASPAPESDKTILLSGGKMTKALQLARSFHAAGYRAVLVETEKYWLSGHRFSKAVDRFYTVPAPQTDPEGYTQALLAIAKRENVEVYIPVSSPVASYYDSLAKPMLSGCCQVFHFDAELTQALDNKFAFAELARSLGLSVPPSFLITAPEQVLSFDFSQMPYQYILKSILYDSVHWLDLTKLPCATPQETEAFVRSLPISEATP
jgi:predicted ATP-grasp superfamily ATP-dependent carboligase